MSVRVTVVGVVLGTALWAAGARAERLVAPPRPGQIGLCAQGLYGSLLKSGEFGRDFSSGPGLAVQLRYRMRYERGFGLSFEAHNFDVRPTATFTDPETGGTLTPDSTFAPKKLTFDLYGVDFYQMAGTRTATTRFVSVGAGLAHPVRTLNDNEIDFTGGEDGAYVTLGAGMERFFWQSWAWTIGARYYAVFRNGSTNHDLQAAAGLVFYATL
jgi:hypothetical protein